MAYAKINLALHVRAREPDGYHRIETLFAFAEDGDRLSVEEGEGLSLRVTGPFAVALKGEADNLVLRAAEALRIAGSVTKGAKLLLDKRLPVASGLGGGSADAAAALKLLMRWWQLDLEEELLLDVAAGLGADVPACVWSRTCRGEGRGDRLTVIDGFGPGGMPLLIVNPLVPVPTGQVFAGWDGLDGGALADGEPIEAARQGRNDLEMPALAIAPEIGEVLALLREAEGVVLGRMSGSGASCFALFETEAERDVASERIRAARPHWWQLSTCLR